MIIIKHYIFYHNLVTITFYFPSPRDITRKRRFIILYEIFVPKVLKMKVIESDIFVIILFDIEFLKIFCNLFENFLLFYDLNQNKIR